MLRRLSRPFAALFALWFALVMGDPMVLHSCPMHGAQHGMHAGGHAGGHEAAHGGSTDTSHHGGTSNICTCVGQCSASVAVALLPAPPTFTVPAHVAQPDSWLEQPAGYVPASPDLRLPFANGPPAA